MVLIVAITTKFAGFTIEKISNLAAYCKSYSIVLSAPYPVLTLWIEVIGIHGDISRSQGLPVGYSGIWAMIRRYPYG